MLIAGYTGAIFMLIPGVNGCFGVWGRAKLAQDFTSGWQRPSKSCCGDVAEALHRELGLGQSGEGTPWWELGITAQSASRGGA